MKPMPWFDASVGRCPECGADVSGGRTGCQRAFDDVLAREFSDYRYAREHRLTVDAYSLQHPDKYMRSGKSYAAHLTGMYAALKGEFTAEVHRAVQQWLNGSKALQRPDHPAAGQRGALTIVHVLEAKGPDDHVQRVREWAASVWEAWRGYRPIAQQWIDAAGTSQEAFQRRRAARRQPARGGRETVCE